MNGKFDSIDKRQLLYLDVGNTVTKGAFKKEGQWEFLHPEGFTKPSGLVSRIYEYTGRYSAIVVCSVREDVINELRQNLESHLLIQLKATDVPAQMLDYNTPETLGADRFYACYGATNITDKAAVVIDAGTATTIDFMGADDVFRGGLIVPGFSSFAKLLPQIAPALPEVEYTIPDEFPGRSTRDSLRWGQGGFYTAAIVEMLNKFEQQFGEFELFLTGGNAAVLQEILPVESKIRPALVFEGMERFLKEFR